MDAPKEISNPNEADLTEVDKAFFKLKPTHNAFPFTLTIDRSNYYSYFRFRKILKKGVLSRIANRAWAEFFLEFEQKRIQKLKEEGIDNIEKIAAGAANAELA